MSSLPDEQRLSAAEKACAQVLKDLELATGMCVESIEIRDLDITRLNSVNSQWLRRVNIRMRAAPGTRWAT